MSCLALPVPSHVCEGHDRAKLLAAGKLPSARPSRVGRFHSIGTVMPCTFDGLLVRRPARRRRMLHGPAFSASYVRGTVGGWWQGLVV